jgi:hypothetical protein
VQRRLNAAAELLRAARLVLIADEDGRPVEVVAAVEPDRRKRDEAGPSLSAPVSLPDDREGFLYAMREPGADAFDDTDLWLLDALAAQLSSELASRQPRFGRLVPMPTRR